jgi:hypothetical protein
MTAASRMKVETLGNIGADLSNMASGGPSVNTVSYGTGTYTSVALLARKPRAARDPAFQGEHNRAVFGRLGLSEDEIERYIARALVSVALPAMIADDAGGADSTAEVTRASLPKTS